MKRKMSQSNYRLLKKEFQHLEQTGHLAPEQADKLIALYKPSEKINFIQTLLVIGSVLIGVGILSFVAGNWQVMPSIVKFHILFLATACFYIGGYKIAPTYPRTSRSLYYIGVFVYGAGIFLIGQMFHLTTDMYADFLLWGIGILPFAYYLKDKFIAAGAVFLFGLYTFTIFITMGNLPYWLFLLIPFLYWMNEYRMDHSKGLFIANTWLLIGFFINIFLHFEVENWVILLIFFIAGLLLTFYPPALYKQQAQWIGSIVYGISGICLTFPEVWTGSYIDNQISLAAIIFTMSFILILLFFLKIGSLPAILITCSLIFRFYVDFSYDFMPKSLFFIIGGCILISFGFWFERSRRKKVESHEQHSA